MDQALVKLIPRVDVINTFRVSAGHFACLRVVSRSQIQRFRSSAPFLKGVRFPASSTSEAGQAERLGMLSLSSTSPSTFALMSARSHRWPCRSLSHRGSFAGHLTGRAKLLSSATWECGVCVLDDPQVGGNLFRHISQSVANSRRRVDSKAEG